MADIVDIRAIKLEEAGLILGPVLASIYQQYGLELTVLLLQYYSAKGIIFSPELTDQQKTELIMKCQKSFETALVINVDKLKRMK